MNEKQVHHKVRRHFQPSPDILKCTVALNQVKDLNDKMIGIAKKNDIESHPIPSHRPFSTRP